jgi:hypothetical protein
MENPGNFYKLPCFLLTTTIPPDLAMNQQNENTAQQPHQNQNLPSAQDDRMQDGSSYPANTSQPLGPRIGPERGESTNHFQNAFHQGHDGGQYSEPFPTNQHPMPQIWPQPGFTMRLPFYQPHSQYNYYPQQQFTPIPPHPVAPPPMNAPPYSRQPTSMALPQELPRANLDIRPQHSLGPLRTSHDTHPQHSPESSTSRSKGKRRATEEDMIQDQWEEAHLPLINGLRRVGIPDALLDSMDVYNESTTHILQELLEIIHSRDACISHFEARLNRLNLTIADLRKTIAMSTPTNPISWDSNNLVELEPSKGKKRALSGSSPSTAPMASNPTLGTTSSNKKA